MRIKIFAVPGGCLFRFERTEPSGDLEAVKPEQSASPVLDTGPEPADGDNDCQWRDIDASDLSTIADGVHLNTASLVTIGERYALAMH
jgi:hypothetical protein